MIRVFSSRGEIRAVHFKCSHLPFSVIKFYGYWWLDLRLILRIYFQHLTQGCLLYIPDTWAYVFSILAVCVSAFVFDSANYSEDSLTHSYSVWRMNIKCGPISLQTDNLGYCAGIYKIYIGVSFKSSTIPSEIYLNFMEWNLMVFQLIHEELCLLIDEASNLFSTSLSEVLTGSFSGLRGSTLPEMFLQPFYTPHQNET